jgi:hypothetical protein
LSNGRNEVCELINITEEELKEIENNVKEGKKVLLHNSRFLKIKIYRINKKIYRVINYYSEEKKFDEVFCNMLLRMDK